MITRIGDLLQGRLPGAVDRARFILDFKFWILDCCRRPPAESNSRTNSQITVNGKTAAAAGQLPESVAGKRFRLG